MREPKRDNKCVVCGVVFKTYRHKCRAHCSRKCMGVTQAKQYAAARSVHKCEGCGKQYSVAAHRIAVTRFCSRACANPVISKEYAPKRGDLLRGTGKRTKYLKLNNRHMHRVVMEKKLGRALRPGEVVHHIDGNSWNNDPKNLMVTTQSEHVRIHAAERRRK